MVVPLVIQERTIGAITLSHNQPGWYTAHHARLARAIANQAAIALENARLYQQAQRLAALEERSRLARELHDSVTQALFSMTMHTRAAEMAIERERTDPDGAMAQNLRALGELTRGALAEMRALIFELRPRALQEEGLVAALRKQAAAIAAREGLRVEVEAPEARVPLAPVIEEHLYRLAQEALHNVVKHACASRVLVRVEVGSQDLRLEVRDDGVGFDPQAVPAGRLGLHTMAERSHQLGGNIEIQSCPGQGTSVRVVMPCAEPERTGGAPNG
jgi:signal transduction histidine kinase